MKKLLSSIDNIVHSGVKGILVITITSLVFLAVAQVLLRYIFRAPTQHVDEIITFLATWLYMLGSINASIEEKHINVRILEIYSKRIRYISGIRLISALISILVSAWLAYWGYDFFIYSLYKGKTSIVFAYPLVLQECSIFVAFLLMHMYAWKEAYKYMLIFKNNDEQGVDF
ncbi:TRAP transporter small permease [Cloacibacillus evryensis]|uniref:TRAP transporter small permease n=1 Tax=Cloacibacillus evryensis TaxID=508460 RepID=UPI00210E648F|nr:TRAP transporter small permease [Cloacibacillus evryensis]MCQ4764652.1 TRAP transporter small permease [Cloacibacillus evryensis]